MLPAAPAQADASFWMQGVQAEVRVISAFTATGETETTVPLGLEFQMNEGWHIYWRTPGEAGLPPELDHGPSLNVAETAFSWPVPTRDVTYGIETFVYKDRVVLPLEVSLQNPGEPLDLRGKVDFLICADVCIPDSVEVDFSLPGGAAEIAEGEAALLNSFETRIPADNSGGVGLQVETVAFEPASDPDNPLLVGFLDTRLASVFEMTAPDVFAEVPEGFSVREPMVTLSEDAMMAQVRSPVFRESWAPTTLDTAAAVITVADGIRGVELPSFRLLDGFSLSDSEGAAGAVGSAVAGPLAPLDLSLTSVLGILVLAVIGGFILNFMPCVLPVLSLKMFSVVSHGGQADARIRLSFAATALGILVSFLALALAFAGLKLAGASFGWGVQFTQPAFILVLLAVLVGFALNLFGLFEIPNIPGLGGLGANQRGFLGDFTSGVLATLLATPCSAPFPGYGHRVCAGSTGIGAGADLPVRRGRAGAALLRCDRLPAAGGRHAQAGPVDAASAAGAGAGAGGDGGVADRRAAQAVGRDLRPALAGGAGGGSDFCCRSAVRALAYGRAGRSRCCDPAGACAELQPAGDGLRRGDLPALLRGGAGRGSGRREDRVCRCYGGLVPDL